MTEPTSPRWPTADVLAIQKELQRLGLYRLNLDGQPGPGTSIALVEAYGGDAWRARTAAEVRAALAAAQPPDGPHGERRLRYGTLCRDGLLDVAVGVGFDETDLHKNVAASIEDTLQRLGFRVDATAALGLYTRAGRSSPPADVGTFYVRERALSFAPAVGAAREIDAVVRLLVNLDGSKGVAVARSFQDALMRADVSYYTGHGRYGSGPDFDAGMQLEFVDAQGVVTQSFGADYEAFEHALEAEGKALTPPRGPWAQFLDRVAKGTARVRGFNEGNLFLNPSDKHEGEFGAKLMYWNLQRTGAAGATLATGPTGTLATPADPLGYQLWVFDGCRTEDYVQSIRATPARTPRQVDVISTKAVTYFSDKVPVFEAFFEGLLAQSTADGLVRAMDARNVTERKEGAVTAVDGLSDNPIIP
jgi:hypothetical protein